MNKEQRKSWIKPIIISCLMLLFCFGLCACKKEDNSKYTLLIYVDDKIYQTLELDESEIETYTLPTLDLQKDNLYYFSGWTGDVKDNKLKVNYSKILVIRGVYKPIFSVSQNGELGVYANETTRSFKELIIPSSIDGVNIESIGSNKFRAFNNLTTIVLPTTLQSIGEDAFEWCWGLREVINLSDLNIEIGSADNGGVGFHAYHIGSNLDDRLEYQNIDGTLYVEENEHLIAIGVEDRNTKEIIIDENTDSISNFAFAHCENVEKVYYNATACYNLPTSSHSTCGLGYKSKNVTVYIGANVKNIPARLFNNSWSDDFYGNFFGSTFIKNVIFEEGSQCVSIGDYAFNECIYLEAIEIPHNVNNIGDFAYYTCVSVNKVNYNAINCKNVSYLSFSFSYSSQQREVVVNIGRGVQKIPDYLFGSGLMSSNSSIAEINFEENSVCDTIGIHAFSNSNITKIILPDSINKIENYAFSGCSLLEEVELSSSLKSIGERAFQNCESLKTIYIPKGVKEIGPDAFTNSSLSTIVLPDSIEKIGEFALKLAKLTNIYFFGTADQWSIIQKTSDDYDNITIFYYIKNENDVPTDGGNYWHYDTDGKTPIIWKTT